MPRTYNIQQGNTLGGIAQQYGFSVQDILNANQGNSGAIPDASNPNLILAGGSLNIPDSVGNNSSIQTTMPYRTNTNNNLNEFDQYYSGASVASRESDIGKDANDDISRINSELKNYRRSLKGSTSKLIDSLTRQYDLRKGQQEQITRQNVKGAIASGYRTGTTQYAQNYQSELVSEKERAGIQKLAELDAEEAQKISEAEIASADKDYAAFNDAMSSLRTIRKDKASAVSDLYKEAVSYSKTLQDMQLDKKRYELDVRKENRLSSESSSGVDSDGNPIRPVKRAAVSNRGRRRLNRNGLDDPMIEGAIDYLAANGNDVQKLFAEYPGLSSAQKRLISKFIK